ncbi:MAG: copper oxidase [Actinomycetota bacterium]
MSPSSLHFRLLLGRFLGTAAIGMLSVLSGLAWDMRLHTADHTLAMREGIFTLGNPGHSLLATGLALMGVGIVGAIVTFTRMSAARARAPGRSRRAPALLLTMAMVGGVAGFSGAQRSLARTLADPVGPPSVPSSSLPVGLPIAASPEFTIKDGPIWFDSGVAQNVVDDVLLSRSLAAVLPGSKVKFKIAAPDTDTAHTITSVIWPTGATGAPFDQAGAFVGDLDVTLKEPGLYAFQCTVHPYMLGAVVVDDPATGGADFGRSLSVRGIADPLPSDADYIFRLVRTFFVITNPANWKRYSDSSVGSWDPKYPPAPILTHDANGKEHFIPNLDKFFQSYFHEPSEIPMLDASQKPKTPGVGEVWIDMQMEKYAGKAKPGSATAVNTESWEVTKKFAMPQVNLNNPHNMWTDRDHKVIYQTQWFSNKLTVFDPSSGQVIREIEVGPSPAHAMTRTDTDQIHVGLNGGNAVMELSPGATKIDRKIAVTSPGEGIAHPHAHWMSHDGKLMIAPNANFDNATLVDVPPGTIKSRPFIGSIPIASSMSPNSDRSYVASLMSNWVMCVSNGAPACGGPGAAQKQKKIALTDMYDYVTGEVNGGPAGLQPGILPIQTPVSPDGNYMLTANAVSGNISVIDSRTDELIKTLPCDPGCHGINFGAKKGGGYYGYVSSKFANTLIIVDGDPNGDGNAKDATIAGKMILDAGPNTKMDDTPTENPGMGGQGVLALPLVYNGWVQNVPDVGPYNRSQLTCQQRSPIDQADCSRPARGASAQPAGWAGLGRAVKFP